MILRAGSGNLYNFQGMTSRLCVDGLFFRFLVSGSKVCFVNYFFSKVLDENALLPDPRTPFPLWKMLALEGIHCECLSWSCQAGRGRRRREKVNESYQFQPSQVSYHKCCAVYLYCIYIYMYMIGWYAVMTALHGTSMEHTSTVY